MPPNRTLTDEDITALSAALNKHSACQMGLTPDEVTTLKRLLSAFNKAAGIVGTTIIIAFIGGMIALFSKGFWASLAAGAK